MSDNEDSDEEFKMRMSAFMGRIEEHLTNQKEVCDRHRAKTDKLHEDIYGNGSMGIKTRLVLVYSAVGVLALVIGADHPLIAKIVKKFIGG